MKNINVWILAALVLLASLTGYVAVKVNAISREVAICTVGKDANDPLNILDDSDMRKYENFPSATPTAESLKNQEEMRKYE